MAPIAAHAGAKSAARSRSPPRNVLPRLPGARQMKDLALDDLGVGTGARLPLHAAAPSAPTQDTRGRRSGALALGDLMLLTAILHPILGRAAQVMVSRSAVDAEDRNSIVDALANDLSDPALRDAFRVAARVALTLR